MKLWVENIKGEHCLVDLEPDDSGARIQEKIVNNVLLKKGAVSLFYDCEAITPEDTVESLKMEPFDVITVFAQSQNPYAPLKAKQPDLYTCQSLMWGDLEQQEVHQQIKGCKTGIINNKSIKQQINEGLNWKDSKLSLIQNVDNAPYPFQLLQNNNSLFSIPFQRFVNPQLGQQSQPQFLSSERQGFIQNSDIGPNVQQQQQLNSQDRQSILEITQMGFSEEIATQAYLETGKDKQEAVNYLLEDDQEEKISVASQQQI